MPALVLDLLSTGALALLLVVAFTHPRAWLEAGSGLAAAGLLVAVGALSLTEARDQVDVMLPVVLFLVASLVVAEACAAEGVFAYLGELVSSAGRRDPRRVLVVAVVAAAVVTAVLSLDATVVMLTPVVLAAAGGHAARRPLALVCVRLANSASLLLPVSNLTNLLALPRTQLGFLAWVGVMTLPWLAVVAVEYAGVRLLLRRDLGAPALPAAEGAGVPAPRFALAVLGVMLLGFAGLSPLGVEPFWVAGAAGVVLAVRGLTRGTLSTRRLVDSAHLPFAVFVLGLAVVVAGVATSFLGGLLDDLVGASVPRPPTGDLSGLVGLLAVAAVATVLANVVNNLPATLLLLPLVAPLGTPALLAALVGVNVGAALTYPGSLANLLWRRVLVRAGAPPPTRTFHLHGAVVTPVAVVVAVATLWLEMVLGWL